MTRIKIARYLASSPEHCLTGADRPRNDPRVVIFGNPAAHDLVRTPIRASPESEEAKARELAALRQKHNT